MTRRLSRRVALAGGIGVILAALGISCGDDKEEVVENDGLQAKVGSLTQPDSKGKQKYDLGFRPKALMFFWTDNRSDGNVEGFFQGIGFATDRNHQATIFQRANNMTRSSRVRRLHNNKRCIDHKDVDQDVALMRATFDSANATGFTLNWNESDRAGRIVNFLALGGGSLERATVVQFDSPVRNRNREPASQPYDKVGFKPDCILTITIAEQPEETPVGDDDSTNKLQSGFGFAVANGGQAAIGLSVDEGGAAVTNTCLSISSCVVSGDDSLPGEATIEGALTSMDEDGFTINWTTLANSPRPVWALCLKGGQYQVGSVHQPSTLGIQVNKGLGFKPLGLLMVGSHQSAPEIASDRAINAIGVSTGLQEQFAIWGGYDEAAQDICNSRLTRSAVVTLATVGEASLVGEAVLANLDDDGFTMSWTKTDETPRLLPYLAFG